MQEAHACTCCGQSFELVDEEVSEYKSAFWPGLGDVCIRCYLDMLDSGR